MKKFVKSVGLALFLATAAMVPVAHAGSVTTYAAGCDGDADNVDIDSVSAVPEAGTLSLMVVGLGLIGLRLRRKNK